MTKKLLALRPLCLINSIPTLFITDYFTAQMLISIYIKAMLFLVTKLLPTTLIILGMLWLQKYKPCLSFRELKICFDLDYYSRNCLQG